jgi:two-component system, LytTR family, sensor kinase
MQSGFSLVVNWYITGIIVLACTNAFTILFLLLLLKRKNRSKQNDKKIELQQLHNEGLKAQLEMEQIINFFTTSLVSKNTKEDVAWDVARNLIYKLGFANCMIYLWNDDQTLLLQKAGYGPNGSLELVIKEQFSVELWQGIVGHVAATKKPIVVGDTSKDPRYRPDILIRSSELAVPALYNGELIGVIDSEDFRKDHYTPQHVQVLTTIATLMAAKLVAIEADDDIRKKKEEISNMNVQVAQLELAALRSQMNPHFLFNSLNSIHKYIWENRPEDASEYLTKFSKLIRMILENSKEKSISLSAEIGMLHLYIELEHRRCNSKFSYRFTVDNTLDARNIAIPSMIIQPYVENAIWHGLVQKEGAGELMINITSKGNILECCVEDDGIGRQKAMQLRQEKQGRHTPLGLGITHKRLQLMNMEKGEDASVTIIDKKDTNGNAGGTKVILHLPVANFY